MAKIIDSGISVDHASDWTIPMAVREIVQNWLDVKNEFVTGGTISWKDGFATIKDSGPGMETKNLAFGLTDKSSESIGQFGEGLKSAFLVFAREGRDIQIRTNGLIIRPVIRTSKNFDTDTLHYRLTKMEARHTARLKGTKVQLECSEDELGAGKTYFVELASRSGDLKWLDKGKISLPGGIIYIKGSAVATVENAMFSYHLTGEEAASAINRDRSSLDMEVVEPMIANLIGNTSSTEVMEKFLDAVIYQSKPWERRLVVQRNSFHNKPQVWMRVWNREFSKMTILPGDYDGEAEYRGYQVLGSIEWNTMAFLRVIGVRNSNDVVQVKVVKPKVGKVGVRSLDKNEYDNYRWAVRMTKKHYADTGKIIICTNPGAVIGLDGAELGGLYDPNKNVMYIDRGSLRTDRRALHVVLHEAVHKVTGTSDCTEQFERALLDVAVGMIMKRKRN